MFSFIKLAVAAMVLSASTVSAVTESQAQDQFTSFVKSYSKVYSHDEFFPRYTIFKQNLAKVEEHNAGNHTYTLGINEFADMTFDEFHAKMTGYNHIKNDYLRNLNVKKLDTSATPASVDWTTKGAVTQVKNQQQCGSCWSFSTTGSVEGAWAIAGNPLVALSEQNLIDCSTAYGNQGCNGGLMDNAFQWIISNGGICSEASYPYTASGPNNCKSSCSTVATISSYADVSSGDEDQLAAAVALGPVSVAIEADKQVFQMYQSGVLTSSGCGTQLDHGVLAVGYGTDSKYGKFWKVKNSWGASWGEAGYIRMARGSNECGISAQPSYPIVKANVAAKNSFRF